MKSVILPQGTIKGTLSDWLVTDSQHVSVGQPIAKIESDDGERFCTADETGILIINDQISIGSEVLDKVPVAFIMTDHDTNIIFRETENMVDNFEHQIKCAKDFLIGIASAELGMCPDDITPDLIRKSDEEYRKWMADNKLYGGPKVK